MSFESSPIVPCTPNNNNNTAVSTPKSIDSDCFITKVIPAVNIITPEATPEATTEPNVAAIMSPASPVAYSPMGKFTTDHNGVETATNWLGMKTAPSKVSYVLQEARDSGVATDWTQFKNNGDGAIAFKNTNNDTDAGAGIGLFLPSNHAPLKAGEHLIAFDGEMRAFSTIELALAYKADLEAQGDDNRYVMYATIEETPTDQDPNKRRRGVARKAVAVVGVFTGDKASMANDPTFGIVEGTPLHDYAVSKINAELNYEVILDSFITLPLDTGNDKKITLANRPCWSLVAKGPIIPCVDNMPTEVFVYYGNNF